MSQPFLFGSINLPEDMEHEMKADAKHDLISVRLNNTEHHRVLIGSSPVACFINLTEIKLDGSVFEHLVS